MMISSKIVALRNAGSANQTYRRELPLRPIKPHKAMKTGLIVIGAVNRAMVLKF